MKKAFIIIMVFLTFAFSSKAIELEGRTGASVSNYWGLHLGAYIGIPINSWFAIRPAFMLHTVEWDSSRPADKWRAGLIVPVFASFRLPLSQKTNLRIDAGPYFGASDQCHLGGAAELGVEIGKFYVGAGYFQNCIHDTDYQLNISVGYKFVL